jgi:S1-C subfamily serine protease
MPWRWRSAVAERSDRRGEVPDKESQGSRFSHQTLRNRPDDRTNRPAIRRSHVTTLAGKKEPMYDQITPLTPSSASAPTEPAAPLPVYEPAPVFASATPVTTGQRRAVGPGFVLSAVLASAILASGGTYLAVSAASGTHLVPASTPVGNVASSGSAATGNASAATGNGSVVDIVKAVSPAVVTIVSDGITSTDPQTGQTQQGTATGSGVIFDANGLILTNHHVVAGDPSKITVNLKDGRSLDATIYGIDTLTDLAIVKVQATGLPTAPIGDSSTIQVGQQAIAIGSPLGEFTDSVTSGIISALGRSIPVDTGEVLTNLIQTDTAINPGNSGGPLFDPSGKVIGINTAGASGGAQGIGFAIPIDIARPLLAQASAGQPLARPYLGIRFETIDPALQTANSLPVANGAWIPTTGDASGGQVIVPDGPAAQGGLQTGDIITAVNGTTLDATHPLDVVTSQLAPGASVKLDVLRNGQTVQLTVVLGTRPTSA